MRGLSDMNSKEDKKLLFESLLRGLKSRKILGLHSLQQFLKSHLRSNHSRIITFLPRWLLRRWSPRWLLSSRRLLRWSPSCLRGSSLAGWLSLDPFHCLVSFPWPSTRSLLLGLCLALCLRFVELVCSLLIFLFQNSLIMTHTVSIFQNAV